MASPERKWWKDGTIYQIYPASYKDSNGDGLGDVPGIISKLDYIRDLGIDIVWLSPMYESPQFDMGYDISDYQAVHKPYGTVADMEDLIEACHARGMRLLLDLVVNHTSSEHAWFKESRSSKTNPKRDWYIWRPAKYVDGRRMPPNNWRSYFSGSAWTWDDETQEYYLHLFAAQQPDLNWNNDETRQAIYDNAMRFWLNKGVDGFRVDTVNMYSKGEELPDAPIVDDSVFPQPASALFCNGPRMHEFLREMNAEVLSHYDTMTVGECPHTPDSAKALQYVSAADPQLSMLFQFNLVDLGNGPNYKYEFTPFTFQTFKDTVTSLQNFIRGTDGWTSAFCENHDQGRSVSRFGDDSTEWRAASAKMLAVMMGTLTGTLFVYQGQEIGMINAPATWSIDEFKDVESSNYYREVAERTEDPAELQKVMDGLHIMARDHARLPMQWDSSRHAGFSTAQPWMRVHDDYAHLNVALQEQDPASVLNFWRKMLRLRKDHNDLFGHGSFRQLNVDGDRLFFYEKMFGADRIVVGLNFSSHAARFSLSTSQPLVSSYGDVTEIRPGELRPWEGCVWFA